MPVHVFHPALPRAWCRLPNPTRLLSARYPTRLVGRGYADNMANPFDPCVGIKCPFDRGLPTSKRAPERQTIRRHRRPPRVSRAREEPPLAPPRPDGSVVRAVGLAYNFCREGDPTKERVMQLTPQQLKDFNELGYLVLPNCFSAEEIAVLRSEAEGIFDSDRQEVWREKSGAPRTAFAAHTYNKAFAILGCTPRLIKPLEQFFGEPVYLSPFKI